MSVYVDDARLPFGRMLMCHMVADTRDELFAMAERIGVATKWVQHIGTYREHFDVCLSARDRAVAAGACRITRRRLAEILLARKDGSRWYPKNWSPPVRER